jgi:hypothetical protein
MALVTNLEPQQSNYSSSSIDDLSSAIEELRGLIEELLATNGPAWAPLISQWSLSLLGEISSRHSGLITKVWKYSQKLMEIFYQFKIPFFSAFMKMQKSLLVQDKTILGY